MLSVAKVTGYRFNLVGFGMRFIRKFILNKIPDPIFANLKNIFFMIKKSSLRVHASQSLLKVRENETIWWTHRKRFHLYGYGLQQRGASIGKSYMLGEISFMPEDCIVDCGANMGDLQMYFKNLRIPINYIGIEPNPIDYRCLTKNTIAPGKALNVALWHIDSKMTFYVDTASASSSLIEPPYFTEKVIVDSVRLDSLELPKRIKLFKVEGEGAEPEIIEGARGVYSRIEYISVDAGPERGIEQTSTRNDVLKVLENTNFELVMENPYHRKTLLFRNKEIN